MPKTLIRTYSELKFCYPECFLEGPEEIVGKEPDPRTIIMLELNPAPGIRSKWKVLGRVGA